MPEYWFLVPGLTLAILGLFAVRRAARVSRVVRDLPRLPLQTIADLDDGLRAARGTVESPQPLSSPFHQRPCVYYAYRVEQPGPVAKKLATGKDWAPLILRDDTGVAEVQARAAMIRAPHETITTLTSLTDLTPAQRAFLDQAGIEDRHLSRFSSLRVVEYTLEPGDLVHVVGIVERQQDRKGFYRGRHSPLAVSQARDAGLIPGLRNELLLFSASSALLLLFATLFLVASFA